VFDPVKARKLPRLRDTHHWAAKLKIPNGAGRSKKTSGNHVDFWKFAEFDMTNSIDEIVEIS
jgi:hypothetical protein